MNNDSENNDEMESLIKAGLIGATIGAFLSEDKEEGMFIGSLLGAFFSATKKANEEAKKTNLPIYEVENFKLYAKHSNGEKKFIKDIPKPDVKLPNSFKLK